MYVIPVSLIPKPSLFFVELLSSDYAFRPFLVYCIEVESFQDLGIVIFCAPALPHNKKKKEKAKQNF